MLKRVVRAPVAALFVPSGDAFNDGVIVAEGDSITAAAFGYVDMFETAFPGLTVHNLATGGQGLNNLEADIATALAYDAEVVSCLIGANDLISSTATAYYDRLVDYAAAFKAQGAKFVICTVLPQGPGTAPYLTHNARRAELNPMLRAGRGTDFDGVVDFDSTIMGLDETANNNVTYFDAADLHPTEAGHAIMYQIYKGEMNAVRGLPNSVTQFAFTDLSGQALSTFIGSNTITITGLGYGETKPYSVSSGHSVRKRTGISGSFGSWTVDGSGTVQNGDGLEVGAISSGSNVTATNVVLTVGSVSDTFTITTLGGSAMIMNGADKAASLTVSGDGLTISQATDPQAHRLVRSTIPFTGKRYAEMTCNSAQGVFRPSFGVCNAAASLTAMPGLGNTDGGGLNHSGAIEPSVTYSLGGPANGDVIMIAIDEPNDLIWMGKNGTWMATTNPATGVNGESVGALAEYYLFVGLSRADNVTVNTGGSAFAYTPPTGFTAMP